jgi:hypothetical protein
MRPAGRHTLSSTSAAGAPSSDQVLVAEHLALAGVGQDDELVAQVAADRAGVGRIGMAFRPIRAKVRR